MKNKVEFDVRVYPLNDEDSATKAFASVAITVNGEKLAAIRNVRVVDGENGVFVSMPQSRKEKEGQPPTYHDIAYGKGDVKQALNTAVLAEYAKTQSPAYRPPQNEKDEGAAVEPSQASGNIKLVAFFTPLKDSDNSLRGFANVLFKCEGEDLYLSSEKSPTQYNLKTRHLWKRNISHIRRYQANSGKKSVYKTYGSD